MNGEKLFTIQNQDSGFAIVWGFYAAYYSPDMFQRAGNLYDPMAALMPQTPWGLLIIVLGIHALVFAWIGRRALSSVILACAYIYFAVLYYHGDSQLPGGALWGWMGLFNALFALCKIIWPSKTIQS